MSQAVDYINFGSRNGRIRYLSNRFGQYIPNGCKVLDVGCDERVLKQLRPDLDYFGIDISGTPDLRVDLDKTERLPFDDGQFDLVTCCDVLEHLDRLHATFRELVRISNRHVLISLPNCWSSARQPIGRGYGQISFYGLPATPPPDRHRWFFSLSQAQDFAREIASQLGLVVADEQVNEKPRLWIVRMLRRLIFPRQARYLNRYAHTYWVLFRKS